VRSTSVLACWGSNSYHQAGQFADTNDRTSPTDVANGGTYLSVACGGVHTCAQLLTDKSLRCFGSNEHYQLGSNNKASSDVYLAGEVKAVTAGDEHTCSLLPANVVACWGHGNSGQLGTGDYNDRWTPASVNLPNVRLVDAGGAFTVCLQAQ
jgi:alpha-tubulin suppressor-like RCC1 family protein